MPIRTAATLLIALAAGNALSQQTIRVPTDAPNLTLALDPGAFGLAPGDTILLEAGSVNAGSFEVFTEDITIRGEGPTPVVVNAFGTGPVFDVSFNTGGSITFENLRVVNGDNGEQAGGGLRVTGADHLIVLGCEFDGNYASDGGGVYAINMDLTMDGCAFTNCDAEFSGGGLRSGGPGTDTIITNTTFSNCNALNEFGNGGGQGGALNHGGGGDTFLLSDSVFSGNTADSLGGAIDIRSTTVARFTNVQFFDNTAVGGASADGGGVYVAGLTDYTFEGCTFERNICNGSGGALRYNTASGDVIDCVFIDNEASSGGAMQVVGNGNDVRVINSTFDGNSARRVGPEDNSGGAILVNSGTSTESMLRVYNSLFINNTAINGGAMNAATQSFVFVDNSTFWNNDADTEGGAVWRSAGTSDTFLNNSIFHENLPADEQVSIFGSGQQQVNYSHFDLPYTATGVGNLDGDPMLVDPSGGDFSLMPGSPAIDSGDTTRYGGPGSADSLVSSDPARFAGPGSDLALNPRVQDDPDTADTGVAIFGGVIDMGAFEFTVPTGSTCAADVNGDGLATPADFTAWLAAFNIGCP